MQNFTAKVKNLVSKVIVLTSHSLLAQGIIANLRRSSLSLEVETLDANHPNLVDTLALMQPEIIITESTQWKVSEACSLSHLFEVLPSLIVLEVNLNNSNVQLIRSDRYDASGFAGFLQVLENVRANLPGIFNPPMPTMQPHD